jgi:hypothetical protein
MPLRRLLHQLLLLLLLVGRQVRLQVMLQLLQPQPLLLHNCCALQQLLLQGVRLLVLPLPLLPPALLLLLLARTGMSQHHIPQLGVCQGLLRRIQVPLRPHRCTLLLLLRLLCMHRVLMHAHACALLRAAAGIKQGRPAMHRRPWRCMRSVARVICLRCWLQGRAAHEDVC